VTEEDWNEEKMKALIVTRVSGFVPQFEMNHVRLLQQMGYEVHYAANFDTVVYGKDNSRLEGTGVVCHHIPFCRSPFSPKVISSYRQLRQLIQTGGFDLIHCHMPMTGVVTRLAAQSVRRKSNRCVPVLYTAHGFHFYHGAPFKNWIYYVPERWLARYTDCLITMNEEDFKRACTFPVRGKAEKIPGAGIDLSEECARCIRNGSDGARNGGHMETRQAIRSKLGVSETDYLLISVGELTARKNHKQILNMLGEWSDNTLKYVICGTGPLQEELEAFVSEKRLGNRVIFAGYCKNVGEMLDAADCFVFPSLQEGLPMAVMEAMHAGLPIVAKKIRGNVDLIIDGKGGILVQNGDVTEYRDAIRKLRGEKELSIKMGEWNQERIRDFSAEKVVNKMEEIYKNVSST